MTPPTDDKQKCKQSPAEEAANRIFYVRDEHPPENVFDVARIIDEALTAERAEAAVTRERLGRVSAFIYSNSILHLYPEEAKAYGLITRYGPITNDGNVNTVDYSDFIPEAANRHNESEK